MSATTPGRRRSPRRRPRRAAAAPAPPPAGAARPAAFRLRVEYDGTGFHGWQEQKNVERTVAAALRRAAEEAGAHVLELGGAGRTDAGVHALAQVAHLRLAGWSAGGEELRRAMNAALPAAIHVLALAPAAAGFHARHDAVERAYLYQLSRRRTALAKRYVWWVRDALDAERLARAADLVVGRHDFRLFCEAPARQPSTLVDVTGAEVAADGDLVLLRLTASHFLWKMVRRLVGALVRVAGGALSQDELATLLAGSPLAADRGTPAEWTAPAAGLFLEAIRYPGDPPLPPLAPAVPVRREP